MDSTFAVKLVELAEKYRAAEIASVETNPGAIKLCCDKGKFRFYYDFSGICPEDEYVNVPLFHWQKKRRYSELRGLLDRGVIYPALSMRIQHIAPRDAFIRNLKDVVFFEANLFEFITQSTVNNIFADFANDTYMNCIMSTDNNVKAGMQLGFSPDKSEPVLLHEVVAGNGTASDQPVDIQMTQYPIYVVRGDGVQTYNEIDFELYGMENSQADCLRFIIWALFDISRIDSLRNEAKHLEKVWLAAKKSGESLARISVEG